MGMGNWLLTDRELVDPKWKPTDKQLETFETWDLKKYLFEYYPSGELDDLVKLGRDANRRCENDDDIVMALTGFVGRGKSTIANEAGILWDRNKYSLSGDKNCLYSPDKELVKNQIETLPRYSVINSDEAVKLLYNKEWQRHSYINKVYTVCRDENKISINCMPSIRMFDPDFRKYRITHWFHCQERGLAVIFCRDESCFADDPWYIEENQKRIVKTRGNTKIKKQTIQKLMNYYRKLDTFKGYITYPAMPAEIYKFYKYYKSLYKYQGLEEEGPAFQKWKNAAEEAAKMFRTIDPKKHTYEWIGDVMNISKTEAYYLVRGRKEA